MEIMGQTFLPRTTNRFGEKSSNSSSSSGTPWTAAENKMFENALAVFDMDTPDRWHRVAELIPGKSVGDVFRQYQDLEKDISSIEAGLFPIPAYDADADASPPFTLHLLNTSPPCFDPQAFNFNFHNGLRLGKRPSSVRTPDLNIPERKKGVPWTEEEHKLFLLGLKKYGKGDWRNISRSFVLTRTPTQVASHAQKYFIRQLSGGKDKRRASIHDITTVDTQHRSLDNNKLLASQEQLQLNSGLPFQWNQSGIGAAAGFSGANENMHSSPPYRMDSFGPKAQGQNNLHKGGGLESYIDAQRMVFQLQSRQNYPCG